ncbi:Hypothetical protein DEACI_2983 [Acididesulfobacillus acetoxydans]|uniref:Uncharacterized protein n=1 Tax=Acididesulfobacillus acetoxydans TaxID=1561005 RepID=A0A8S0W938_9FIRM|nr:hypothetical protein [Acididesulfobacillus acetoxydans]CAA7602309.1 Hypothetical protein DEACI_2983 [Acididesulfobacillus acetoxydans]CEJ08764.1 Hypothetical protein DEACI_3244 [Acididesulfobacillus acetoxydans]
MQLPQEDVALFYKIFFKLIDFTNERYHLVPGLKKASGALDVDPTEIMPVRDKLWESDEVINQIVADNPLGLSERELSLVASWRGRIVGDFLIYKHLKKFTVFMGNDNLYGVIGIASPIEEIFPAFVLPKYSKTVLLPFEGKIIYDSLLFTYSITYGSGIRKRFNEEYRELKNTTGIITSL